MHKSFYKLDCEPFDLQPNLTFLWMGEKYKEALSVLRYGILDNKGFLLLTGEAGIGKTILLRALTESLAPDVLWAILPNPDVPKMEMFNTIGKGFGMGKEYNSKIEFMLDFGAFLQERRREGKKVLLLVDSAHLFDQENLEELRLLSNIEEADTKLIHIFFSAQPSFNDMLALSRNSAIRQRLSLAHTIEPLTVQETAAYIEHRLRVAGAEEQILTEKAIRSIHQFSGGIPKKINLICQQVLIEGAQQGRKVIEQGAVEECMREFARSSYANASAINLSPAAMRSRDNERKSFKPRQVLIPGIGMLALLVIIVCAGYFFWLQKNHTQPIPPAATAGAAQPAAPAASVAATQASKPAAGTARPQAGPPAPAADSPASIIDRIATRPVAPSAHPPVASTAPATATADFPGNAGAQEDVKAATVTISPATGLAVIQPTTGASKQNQAGQIPAAPAAPSPATAAGGGQQVARNGGEIIGGPHPEKMPAQAPPPSAQIPKTPQTSVSAPPTDNEPSPQLDAALPLRPNSLSLTREGNERLADFADKFKKTGRGKIEVRGYVSSTSNSKENIELSLRRAEAVRDMLIHAGVKPESIIVRGMGNQEPFLNDATFNAQNKNRRVELEMMP